MERGTIKLPTCDGDFDQAHGDHICPLTIIPILRRMSATNDTFMVPRPTYSMCRQQVFNIEVRIKPSGAILDTNEDERAINAVEDSSTMGQYSYRMAAHQTLAEERRRTSLQQRIYRPR